MFRIVAATLILLVSAWSPATADAKRVALVIGMSDYQHLSKLPNPVPDAKAIAAEFKSHGFEVSEYIISTVPVCSTPWRDSNGTRLEPRSRWSTTPATACRC